MSGPGAVTLRGVRVALGGRTVLHDVDLDVPAGSSTVLLGRSGSGKTTLLRAVAGLLDPDAGRIEVGGRAVADPRSVVPAERRGVGMVFQSLELFPHMTVAENLAFGLPGRRRGTAAAEHPRVREVASAVGIEALLRRRPPALSGGERQRTAIARALAPEPGVLLYDEPLANLDPDRRSELRALVRSLRRTAPATVIYVTHDADEALEMGDEVVVLEQGRVVDRGPPERVYRRPACAASARALGAATLVAARREAREGRAVLATALGDFAAPEGGAFAVGLACLRPEQLRPAAQGPRVTVIESLLRGRDWGFSARLVSSGERVFGRSSDRLAAGETTSVAVEGTPTWLPPEPSAADARGAA